MSSTEPVSLAVQRWRAKNLTGTQRNAIDLHSLYVVILEKPQKYQTKTNLLESATRGALCDVSI